MKGKMGLISNIIMQAFNTNALGKPQTILTFSCWFHTVRIFGGECGASLVTHFLSSREKLHSYLIGLHVDAGDWTVQQRISTLAAGAAPTSNGADGANARAIAAGAPTSLHPCHHRQLHFDRMVGGLLFDCCRVHATRSYSVSTGGSGSGQGRLSQTQTEGL